MSLRPPAVPDRAVDAVVIVARGTRVVLAVLAAVVLGAVAFPGLAAAVSVETTGSPMRTTTTARFEGRVNPEGVDSTYHFEYGIHGPCASNPCVSTPIQSAGSGSFVGLVSQRVSGLQPGMTYHYRVVGDDGTPVFGNDRTLTTRIAQPPLTHGAFPGPPSSDRAWELISPSDGGGTLVDLAAISDNGDRALYAPNGGMPDSNTGGFSHLFSERTSTGWKTRGDAYPSRSLLPGTNWSTGFVGSRDLSVFTSTNGSLAGLGAATFRMSADAPAVELDRQANSEDYIVAGFRATSEDGSTVIRWKRTSQSIAQLYDVSSGQPEVVSLLPGNTVPSCGVVGGSSGTASVDGLPAGDAPLAPHWVSANGRFVVFNSRADVPGCVTGPARLYVRDRDTETTRLVSPAPVSGDECKAGLIKSTRDAVYFWTQSRLVTSDVEPTFSECVDSNPLPEDVRDGDVYRFDLDDSSVSCLTCSVPDADVFVPWSSPPSNEVTVSDDGSRIYFKSTNTLLPGTETGGIYRFRVADGDLAYVAHNGGLERFLGAYAIGDADDQSSAAYTPNGSIMGFRSMYPGTNSLNGSDNGFTGQYYRYDDNDRSLICVSCPYDGSAPTFDMPDVALINGSLNNTWMSDTGVIVFVTRTPLLPSDDNTKGPDDLPRVGQDIYEWRDGQLMLVTDGQTKWTAAPPFLQGITPSGNDILFLAAAQLTPDALDAFTRVYTAKIGGGITFPLPPEPCPSDGCPRDRAAPTPSVPPAATVDFAGSGNVKLAKAPKVSVSRPSKAITGSTARLRVKVPGRGRLSVSGSDLRAVKLSVSKASTVTVRVSLTAQGRRRLAAGKRITRRATVSFVSADGDRTAATVSLTFKVAAKKGR